MHYDVVVATLNRPESLRTCLSLLERQTVRPQRVIVVDASDDADTVERRAMTGRDAAIEWRFVRSDRRSSPYQRNLGLAHVQSEVVLVPDDDSMLYPEAAAELLAAYAADTTGIVAAVSAAPASLSPWEGRGQKARGRVLKDLATPIRNRVEDLLVPRPFVSFPRSLWQVREIPGWIDGDRFTLVPSVGGYRLSLRTDLAQKYLFDEDLGYGIGYALHEDMELSMRLQRDGFLLVGAERAPVFHDVHPSRRAGGFNYGWCWIANYVYACRRNIPESSRVWQRDLPAFLRYKLALYAARALVRRDQYSREVLQGARAAWSDRETLMSATPDEIPAVYRSLCDRVIRR